jgi:F420-non-reducing hydrogenase small subunit
MDQGTKMVSALSSVIDSTDQKEVREIIKTIADPLGTFYRFSMGASLMRRVQPKKVEKE